MHRFGVAGKTSPAFARTTATKGGFEIGDFETGIQQKLPATPSNPWRKPGPMPRCNRSGSVTAIFE